MNIPMYLVLGVLTWKLSPYELGLLTHVTAAFLYLVLIILFVLQFSQIYRVNKQMLSQGAPAYDHYEFKQVAILNWAYFVCFGSELAVVSVLPAFFLETFTDLSLAQASMLGGSFAIMNLLARPGGGWVSDRIGRRKSMSIIFVGVAVGYLLLSQITAAWPLLFAFAAVVACSLFVQAGCGAVFAMVPLIKRRMTGQIAGMTGAYGNVGGVAFLTVYSFVDISAFFLVIALSALAVFVFIQQLKEPQGHMTETLDDGSVQRIELG